MPDLYDWRRSDPGEIVARTAERLAAGELVALPTESLYEVAASALNADAVARLCALATDEPLALVLTAHNEARDWLPFLRGPGERLVRKYGPGPWLLQADGGRAFGLLPRLPAAVGERLAHGQHLTLRWPQHPAWAQVQRALKGPLVTVAVSPAATTAAQVTAALGERVALVVDDEPCPVGKPTSLVRVDGKEWQLRREGGLSREEIAEWAACRVLFVCTGNTCRSPMAEALCTTLLAERLKCAPGELPARGFRVQSAGLAAMMGEAAAADAVAIVRQRGGDLSRHASQPISYELYTGADHVFVMTANHLHMLQSARVPAGPVPRLLSLDGTDVADPIGCDRGVYEACAGQIVDHLRRRLPELLES